MKVDGRVLSLGRRQQIGKLRMVEVFAVSVRVDDDALHAELPLAALDLGRGSARILGRNRRES
jgi:hypothetical protein